jgi:uncharacterized membrane protein YdjX (TVP38/TMEM64 family)
MTRAIRVLRPAWRVIVLGALIAAAFVVLSVTDSADVETIRDAAENAGVIAPLVFIVVGALLTCAMFPAPLLPAASGLLFGTALGTPVGVAAATLGAALACTISRFFARDQVEGMLGNRMLGVRDYIEQRGFVAVLYARILPGMPFNVINYVAGLTRVPLPIFIIATAIGTTPRVFVYVALGGNIGQFHRPEAIAALAVMITMGVIALILLYRDRHHVRAAGRWVGDRVRRRRSPTAAEPETDSSSRANHLEAQR